MLDVHDIFIVYHDPYANTIMRSTVDVCFALLFAHDLFVFFDSNDNNIMVEN